MWARESGSLHRSTFAELQLRPENPTDSGPRSAEASCRDRSQPGSWKTALSSPKVLRGKRSRRQRFVSLAETDAEGVGRKAERVCQIAEGD